MNSRQTAAIFGGAPNGHWKATGASLVPLVRMSTTVFDAGSRDPADILGEVDHGYYLVGHRTPSIAESRENFRISARRGAQGRAAPRGGVALARARPAPPPAPISNEGTSRRGVLASPQP